MPDPLDQLTWDGRDWIAAVPIPFFANAGLEFLNPLRDEVLRPWGGYSTNAQAQAAHPSPPPPEDPFDPDILFSDSRFLLRFEVGRGNRTPNRKQKSAWQLIAARGDEPWRQAMDMILADYKTQRPFRVKWWKATYGDLHFDRELPPIDDTSKLLQYFRPYSLKVHSIPGRKSPDVSVHFMCTWIREGFSHRIRDGQPLAVESNERSWLSGDSPTLDHPTLGPLIKFSESWAGRFYCAPMLPYQNIVQQRAAHHHLGINRERPQSLMWWNYAHGHFGLYVFTDPPDSEPHPAQAAAVEEFVRNQERNVAVLLDAIFTRYQQRRDENLSTYHWTGKYPADALPVLHDPEPLKEMMELAHVYVHPPASDGSVRLVLEVHCSFEGAMIILWRNNQIERFGAWSDHKPS